MSVRLDLDAGDGCPLCASLEEARGARDPLTSAILAGYLQAVVFHVSLAKCCGPAREAAFVQAFCGYHRLVWMSSLAKLAEAIRAQHDPHASETSKAPPAPETVS